MPKASYKNNGGKKQPTIRPTLFRSAHLGIAVTSCVSAVKSLSAVFPWAGLDRDQQHLVPHHLSRARTHLRALFSSTPAPSCPLGIHGIASSGYFIAHSNGVGGHQSAPQATEGRQRATATAVQAVDDVQGADTAIEQPAVAAQ
jgi:hypothetical protein